MDIHLITLRKTVLSLFVAMSALVCSADTALAQSATLSASTDSLAFNTNQGTPASQFVTVFSSSGTLPFTATVTSGSSFLGVSVTAGTATVTGTLIQVFIKSGVTLAIGTYPGVITLSSGSQSVPINVTYYYGTNSGGGGQSLGPIAASPTALTFNVAVGGTVPAQTVDISTTGAAVTITVTPMVTSPTGGTWLSVNPASVPVSSSMAQLITVSVSAGHLAAGTYTGQLNVYQNSSTTSSLTIPVTLNVGTTSTSANVSVTPAALTFNFNSGSTAQQLMDLNVSTTSNLVMYVSATIQVLEGAGWLSVNTSQLNITSSAAGQFVVAVNPTSLATGTYSGNVILTISGQNTPLTVPVTVNVGFNTVSELTASPNPIIFNIPSGSSGSQALINQTLTVKTTALGTTVSFTAATSTVDGGTWLTVNPDSALVTYNSPSSLVVSVDPTQLTTGDYSGSVILTPSDGSTALTIPVTVTFGSAPALTIAPPALSFAYQTGTASPPAQTLSLTSSGGMIPFSVAESTITGGSWLVVSEQSGATAASGGGATNLTVYVTPNGLAPGTYKGTITITASSASDPTQAIPVTLLVSSQPILTIGSSSVTFNYEYTSATLPVQQQVAITSSGNPLSFTASVAPGSGGSWLMATPSSGTTPQSLNLSVNPSALAVLAAGTYSETVTVTAPAAGNSPVNINVYLVIGNNTLLTPSQTELLFNYEIGKAVPAIQTFTITSNGSPVDYSVSAISSNCGGQFLSASPSSGTTPGTVAVAISTQGVAVGTCKGSITITSTDADITVGNSPLTIPVTLNVSNSPLLNVSPSVVNVSAQLGTSPASQTIALTSTDPTVALPFNVTSTTNNGSGWLLVGPTSGSTPNNLTLGFQTTGLGMGTYTGSVTVTPTAAGSVPTVIPVTVIISSGATAAVSPATLTFNQPYTGSAPAAQTLQISSSTVGLSFSTSATVLTPSGGTWLTVTPGNGTTPGALMVSVDGTGLSQGSYSGVVTVVIPGAANTPLNISVTLTVGPPLSLTATPAAVSFTYQVGGTAPAPQAVQVTSTSGSLPFAAAAASTPAGLLTFTPTSGTTSGTLSIGLNPTVLATLSAGTYSGTVTLTSSSLPGTSVIVNVALTVQPAQTPVITTVVNAASNLSGAIAPGEIISIYGTSIGPLTPANFQLTSAGKVPTTLGTTEVTFDGIPSPLIYVSSGQINAIVPYEIAGRATTNVAVMNNGVISAALTLNVTDTAPAIFSLSQGGNGQGAILNFNSTVNGASNPAVPGAVISIYATGEGMLEPAGVTGSVTTLTAPFPMPAGMVSLTIGGLPAQVLYAGEAPGLVSGVLQINAIVPTAAGSGPQPVVLTVGTGTNKQQTITVAVQ